MNLVITPRPVAIAGNNDAICEGTSSFNFATRTIPASSANGSVFWTHTGAGSLSSTTAINPVYNVNPADVNTTITFTLTVTSPSPVCSPASSSFTLHVNRAAQVSIPDPVTTVCEPQRINLSGFLGGSATSGAWSLITGGGTLSVSSITGLNVTAVYDTVRADVNNTLVFRLTSNDPDGPGPCVVAFADKTITINESAKVFAGNDFQICEYQDANLNGWFGGSATSVTWSGRPPAQFDNVNNPITTYNLSAAERSATNLVLTFTLTTNDPPGVCPAVSDDVVVTVRDTLNTVAFTPVLGSVYAENDPPVDLTFAATPLGGTYSGPGVSGMFFFPSIANVTPAPPNIITYSYRDPLTGCFSSPRKMVIVNPITDVSFVVQGERVDGFGNAHICANTGDVRLIEIPDVNIPALTPPENAVFDSPDLPLGRIIFDGNDFRLKTNGLVPGTYRIRYAYTNSLGATNTIERFVVIDPAPKSIINVANSCVTDVITFNQSSTIFGPNPSGAFINQWLWEFGDGNGSTSTTPTYQYLSSGTYNVRLRVTTNEGCSHDTLKVLRVGPVPNMAFTWSEFCNGNDTKFTDETSAGISTIVKYTWQFGDSYSVTNDVPGEAVTDAVPPSKNNGGRTGGTFRAPTHRYDLFGQYDVTLTVETDDGCVNSLTQRAFILSYGTPSPTSGYFEDFESGPGTWVATRASRLVPTDTSWIFGLPSGTVINSASSGVNAWWTGGNPNSGLGQDRATYYNNEKSAVIGPCLNLQNIKRPMVSIDYWSDSEDRFDGAVLQYSTDGGQTWNTVGDDGGAGINWYNGRALTGNPGNQALGQFGWAARQSGWKTARYNLDMIPSSERDEVIFRIAFGSNNDNGVPANNIPFEGFAFDNIFIGEKQRNVLVEYFTNAGISPVSNDYLNNLYNNQFSFKDSSDFFKIQYHIANPAADPINQANPNDPAARALLYGVSQPPVGIMDGILYNYYGTQFNGDQTKITAITVDRRALEDPLFRLGVTQVPTNDPTTLDSLHIILRLAYLKPSQPFSGRLFLHAALIESNVSGNVNVVRKLLLSPEGRLFNRTWSDTVSQVVTIKTVIDAPIGINNANLWLAVWVQEDATKTIGQSRLVKLPVRNRTNVVGLENDPAIAQVRDIVIYPNPASKQFNFALEQPFTQPVRTEGFTYNIIDQRGVVVQTGYLNQDLSEPQAVDVQQLAAGMYIVTISRSGKVIAQRKLVILHRH
ncbi:MAG: PKD domain-containing protein [Cyclobacteriaceae bacterium]|nr:PKD domain-containing protein [Cyclobacteriaceae bacterium]